MQFELCTVEPVYNGHPRNLRNWPLNTGGRLIQGQQKYTLGMVRDMVLYINTLQTCGKR